MRATALAAVALGAGVAAGACAPSSGATTSAPPAVPAQTPAPAGAPVLVAAGDIACPAFLPRTATRCHHAAIAALAARLRPAAVALLGDLQYNTGALSEFNRSFARSWGRLGSRLRPAPGNHEYGTPGAAGYYSYFGARAGPGRRGYYSFDLGAWHVVSLNSNCTVVSCTPGSAQLRWLRADLSAHRNRCVLAFWHHPRFSSGFNGNSRRSARSGPSCTAPGPTRPNGHDHSTTQRSRAARAPPAGVTRRAASASSSSAPAGVEQRGFFGGRPTRAPLDGHLRRAGADARRPATRGGSSPSRAARSPTPARRRR